MRVVGSVQLRSRRVSLGRVVVACLALGGLVAAVGVMSASGAPRRNATVVVSTLKTSKFGTILVSGKTLYTLTPKGAGCNAACIKIWPEFLLPKGVTKAKAGPGVNPAKLGTVKRAGAVLQVTYAGKALYWFSFDSGPGKVTGNVTDIWGKWSVVVTIAPTASGSGVTTTTLPSTTTTLPSTTTTLPSTTTSPVPTTISGTG